LISCLLKLIFFSSSAYTKALDDAIAVLDKIAMPVDVNDRKFTVNIYFALDPGTLPMAHLCSTELALSPCIHHVLKN